MSSPAPEQRTTRDEPVTESVRADRRVGLTPISLFVVLLLAYVMIQVQVVLILFLLAIVFATVIERPVQALQRQRIQRPLAILLLYIGVVGGLILAGVVIAPFVGDQVANLRDEAPAQIRDLRTTWESSGNPLLQGAGVDVLNRGINFIEQPPTPQEETAFTVITSLTGAVIGLFAIFAITFYYLMEKDLIRRVVLSEVSVGTRQRVSRIWDDAEGKVGGWIRGQLILCLIVGVAATIGYGIIGLPFWPLLGLWAGIVEIIPIIGPWIGGIPAVIIALTQGWQTALVVIGFIVFIQTMENLVLVPRVMRGTVGLTPLTVFVAILAGTEFYGPVGAILAIPIAAFVQIVLTEYLNARRDGLPAAIPNIPTWRWMRGQLATVGTPHAATDTPPSASASPSPSSSRPDHGGSPDSSSPGSAGTGELRPPPTTSQDTAPPTTTSGAPGWTSDRLNRYAKSTRRAQQEPEREQEQESPPHRPGPPAIGPGGSEGA